MDTTSKLVSPRDIISWNTLLEAAKTRQHKPVLNVAGNLQYGEIPPVLYHRQCRSIFTMKKTLDAIEKQSSTNLETDRNDECTRLSMRQIATSARRSYRSYTREEKVSSNKVSESNHSNSLYETALNNSYDLLFKYIRNDLFSRPRIVTIAKLFTRLVASMHSFDITEVLVSTKKHIRRKLENEFAGSLHIFPDEKGELLVLPDNLSLRFDQT